MCMLQSVDTHLEIQPLHMVSRNNSGSGERNGQSFPESIIYVSSIYQKD